LISSQAYPAPCHLSELFHGGGSNFGIVTRYDMEALDDKKLAHGTRTLAGNHTAQFLSAVVDFTNSQQKYNNDALVPYLLHAEGEDFLENH
jgi:hypothetical protein